MRSIDPTYPPITDPLQSGSLWSTRRVAIRLTNERHETNSMIRPFLDRFVEKRESGSHDDLGGQVVTRGKGRAVNDMIDCHSNGNLALEKRPPINGSKDRPFFKEGDHFSKYVSSNE